MELPIIPFESIGFVEFGATSVAVRSATSYFYTSLVNRGILGQK
jgi:hypothetical protein